MIPKKIAIKITYGYRATDYLIVDNLEDVARAYHAKIEKLPLRIGGKVISGQEIKVIEPDVHSYTGWNRSYLPTESADFAQIERDVPEVISELIARTTARVEAILSQSEGVPQLTGQFETTKLLEN